MCKFLFYTHWIDLFINYQNYILIRKNKLLLQKSQIISFKYKENNKA